jgi:hypothetical protein
MKTTIQNQVMEILDKMPMVKENPDSYDGLEYSGIANELFALAGIDSKTIEIADIPQHTHYTYPPGDFFGKIFTQLIVVFKKDEIYYSLYAGTGIDNDFYFDVMKVEDDYEIFSTIEALHEKVNTLFAGGKT